MPKKQPVSVSANADLELTMWFTLGDQGDISAAIYTDGVNDMALLHLRWEDLLADAGENPRLRRKLAKSMKRFIRKLEKK